MLCSIQSSGDLVYSIVALPWQNLESTEGIQTRKGKITEENDKCTLEAEQSAQLCSVTAQGLLAEGTSTGSHSFLQDMYYLEEGEQF